MRGEAPASVLRREAQRLASLESPSATLDREATTARTAAMIMAEAASSLVAQANYSQGAVRDILSGLPDGTATDKV